MYIKICGLTDVKEAEYLKKNKVDFAGMVLFYEKSKRNITVDKAYEIIDALYGSGICTVAVTVSPSEAQIHEIEDVGFDYIQIHGAIDDRLIELCKLPVLKAFNVTYLDKYEHYIKMDNIKGFVFDAGEPGSGKTFDWNMLKNIQDDKLHILAGGLSADNVARAIKVVKPDGVDVSSSVEYEDRLGKNPDKIDDFVSKVRKACE